MALLRRTFCILLLSFAAKACAPSPEQDTVHVAVASNFTPVLEVLVDEFEREQAYKVVISTGSTGSLYTQITLGAPYNIFLAADQKRPAALEASTPDLVAERFTYATGQLVLWSPADVPVDETSLSSANMRRLAIANPKLAPYGRAAMEVLDATGHAETVRTKIVLAENVGQVLVFTQTRNADLGFVALAQTLSMPRAAQGSYWLPDQSLYTAVKQDAVLLDNASGNPAALAFWAFLKSEKVQTRIGELGYKQP